MLQLVVLKGLLAQNKEKVPAKLSGPVKAEQAAGETAEKQESSRKGVIQEAPVANEPSVQE